MSSEAFGFETTGDEVVARFPERVKGKTFVITGPTPGGLGAESALSLARATPHTLVLLGRSTSSIDKLLTELRLISPSTQLVPLELDLSSLASVRSVASAILGNDAIPHIDALICNAGVMACPHGTTADGIELQFGTNHIGHFLLANLLRPKLSSNGRIVIVSSSAHKFGTAEFEDYNWERREYDRFHAYGESKIANVMAAKSFVKRGVFALSVHPGSIRSNLQRYMTPEDRADAVERMRALDPNFMFESFKTPQQGCATQLVATLDPAAVPGAYYWNCQVAKPKEIAEDEEKAEELWRLSEKIVGQSFE